MQPDKWEILMVIRTWRDLRATLVWTMEEEIEDFLRAVG